MEGFFRDTETQAIVNKNNLAYQSYVQNRDKLLSDKERIDKLENEIGDIKSMIQILIDK